MSPVIVDFIIGIALLAMGRRLFWVFVGSAGFILGMALATHFANGASGVVVVVAAAGRIRADVRLNHPASSADPASRGHKTPIAALSGRRSR